MKFSIASIALIAALFSVIEAQKISQNENEIVIGNGNENQNQNQNQNENQNENENRRNRKKNTKSPSENTNKKEKWNKSTKSPSEKINKNSKNSSPLKCIDTDKKDVRRNSLIGDCSALTNMSFEIDTGYILTPEIIYTYPCSGSYLKYFGSNYNLLEDVRMAINNKGRTMGIDADCFNLCDIDNDSFATPEKSGSGSLFKMENSDVFCDANIGIFNDPSQNRNDDFNNPNGNACDCDPVRGYLAGCRKCFGKVSFNVNTCLDSSKFV